MSERVYSIPADAAPLVHRRVAEAMAWCSSRVALANRLRTPELRPVRWFVQEERRPDGRFHYELLDSGSRAAEVERVGLQRAELLARHGIEITDAPPNPSWGRLLMAEIDFSGWDGLSQGESDGFFDVYDIPPWDGWIHLRHIENGDALLCWVPAPLVASVNKGIAVNCMDCIGWVDRLAYAT